MSESLRRNLALWTGVLAGPVLWLSSFEANFALAPWACIFQAKLALYLVSIAALVLCAASGMLAWFQWKAFGKEWAGEDASVVQRGRLMAIGGVFLSFGCMVIVFAQAIPELILGACE